ncbi:hypothetical protein BC332_14717 [Capsicum chinense]|nr:hypothetical protein BC332_14717 [Capsicum chinense]
MDVEVDGLELLTTLVPCAKPQVQQVLTFASKGLSFEQLEADPDGVQIHVHYAFGTQYQHIFSLMCHVHPSLMSFVLSHATIRIPDLGMMIRQSYKLQRMRVRGYVDEIGLEDIATYCFPKLHLVLHFFRKMENAALVTIARNCPNMIRFCVCLVEPQSRDYLTLGPLDAGFDAIVHHCKGLRQLSLSGLLTDRVLRI